MIHEGVKAKDKKWESGNQYHTCVNTNSPTTVAMCVWPARDSSEMVTFRPPDRKKIEKEGDERMFYFFMLRESLYSLYARRRLKMKLKISA